MTLVRLLQVPLGTWLLVAASSPASAAGFALYEQSASGIGTATAGAAAAADDASTIYFNPAGMTRLSGTQVVLAGAGVATNIEFQNSSSSNPAGILSPVPVGPSGGNAGATTFVPNLYVAHALSPDLRLGIGFTAPFGLRTDYATGWVGRFQSTSSKLTSLNVNPSVAYRVSDALSVGAGVSYQVVSAELDRAVVLGFNTEGTQSFKASQASGWGWNIGATWTASEQTRLGASYRSSIEQTLVGNVSVLSPTGATLLSFPGQSSLKTPSMALLGIAHAATPRWTLLADVAWTQWSVVDQLQVIDQSTGSVADSQRLAFKDAWRLSAGVQHHVSDSFTIKAGVAWDQSPVTNTTRTAIIPDSDRTWLALGARFKASKSVTLDVSYAHIFFQSAPIDQNAGNPTAQGTLSGTYSNSADVLAAQLTLSFD